MAKILLYIAHLAGITPVLIFLIFRRKTIPKAVPQVLPMALLTFISTIIELWVTAYWISNDTWFRLFSLLEFYTVAWFFFNELKERHGKLIIGMIFILTGIWLAITILVPPAVGSDMLISLPETLFTFLLVFLWFRDMFNRMTQTSLLHSYSFYFVAGITFYLAATMFLGILQKQIVDDENLSLSHFWKLNVIAVLIARILFNISIWKAAKSN